MKSSEAQVRILPKADPERERLTTQEKTERDETIARVAEESRRRCTCNQALLLPEDIHNHEGPAADILAAAETQQLAEIARINLEGAHLKTEISKERHELCFLCSSTMIAAGNNGCTPDCPNHPNHGE
ncbi:MAG: hypothetical protein PHO20_03975 [Candidatus Peribacteraceae bacterium]|nr:hypothetical protein [Candidatus Peribacteraceae bacterium]MDD5739899.1 hypothetical protein [Candidatus Peribacteraceae bacterium]